MLQIPANLKRNLSETNVKKGEKNVNATKKGICLTNAKICKRNATSTEIHCHIGVYARYAGWGVCVYVHDAVTFTTLIRLLRTTAPYDEV